VYDVIDSATGARSQPLILMITTAGSDTSRHLLRAARLHGQGARGHVVDETWFGIIFTIDDGDVWHDPAVWRKANPNLGVSVKTDDLAAAVRKALAMPSALNNVLTKR
jgi:phage terminase large subunit-like protein